MIVVATTKAKGGRLAKGDILESRRSGLEAEVIGFADSKTKVKLRGDDGRVRLAKNDLRSLGKNYFLPA